jgi:hypothetical protein
MNRNCLFALACFGAIALVTPAGAAPMSAAGALGSTTTKAAIDQALPDQGLQNVRWGRHWGGHRHRHWGWRRHHWRHYGWHHRRHIY